MAVEAKPQVKRTRGRPSSNASIGADLILRQARKTFAKRGYDATSVREIARDCDVDVALIAHHFGSKEALWVAVVDQIADQAAAMIQATADLRQSALGARARVEQATAILIDQVFDEPDIGMFFSTAATEEGERLDKLIERLVKPYRAVFIPLLVDAAKSGELAVPDADLTFFMLVNAVSKTVSYEHLLAAFSSLPKQRTRYKRVVLETALNMLGGKSQ